MTANTRSSRIVRALRNARISRVAVEGQTSRDWLNSQNRITLRRERASLRRVLGGIISQLSVYGQVRWAWEGSDLQVLIRRGLMWRHYRMVEGGVEVIMEGGSDRATLQRMLPSEYRIDEVAGRIRSLIADYSRREWEIGCADLRASGGSL